MSTYIDKCLRCMENREFESSLLADSFQKEASEKVLSTKCSETSNDEEKLNFNFAGNGFKLPIEADVRAARVNYFTRNANKLVHFRHSIGSPSLLLGTLQGCYFGDEEVDRFFQTYQPYDNVTSEVAAPTKTEIDKFSGNLFLKDVCDCVDISKKSATKYVMVQRDVDHFWNVLMRQKFDLVVNDISVKFAGEAGVDMGGPLWEFFTLTMKRFPDIPALILGKASNVFLKMMPESFRKGDYCLSRQLVGMAIIKIGRGPECFSKSFLKAMYRLYFGDDDIEFEDAELLEKIRKLENGDRSELLHFDISVTGDITTSKKILVASFLMLKHFSAIEQFSKGLGSIDQAFTDVTNLDYMKFFLSPHQHDLTLNDFMSVIKFKNDEEKHSNQWTVISNTAFAVELFFASVANNDIRGFGVNDLLFLFTGMERIAPFGLE